MDPLDRKRNAKMARSRRTMLLKENRSKRQKYNPHQQFPLEATINTTMSFTPRQPLSELTPSFQNSTTTTRIDGQSQQIYFQNLHPALRRGKMRDVLLPH